MKRMITIALTAGFVGIAGTRADDGGAELDRSKTKKAIEAAEERMAEYCSAHEIEKKKMEDGSYGPNFVVDADNPLSGLAGVFKARFNATACSRSPSSRTSTDSRFNPRVSIASMRCSRRSSISRMRVLLRCS